MCIKFDDAIAAGLPSQEVRRFTRSGRLIPLSRGVDPLPDLEPAHHQTLAAVATRIPNGIMCLLTALRFHDLGSQHPREVWVAVDRRAGAPRVDVAPIHVVRLLHLWPTDGVEHHTIGKTCVKVTSPARTVAECFKFRNRFGLDLAIEALWDYRRLRKGTAEDLWHHAEHVHVGRVIRPYWDALA